MLGQTLVTKQTGPSGKPVNTLYVARKMKLSREMYFAILLDRKTAGPVMIGCRCVRGFVPWLRWGLIIAVGVLFWCRGLECQRDVTQ